MSEQAPALLALCLRLQQSEWGTALRESMWVFPSIETVHVLGLAVSVGILVMLDLRLVGIAGRRQSLTDMAARFLPWVWVALVALLCSGTILIIAEPGRELINQVFWLKMSMLAAALALTWTFQHMLRRSKTFWDRNRAAAVLLGGVSLLLWVGIIGAGRWIAYVEHG